MTWFWVLLAASSGLAVLAFVSLVGKTKHCCDYLLQRHWEVWQREQRRQARARGKARTAGPPVAPKRPTPVASAVAEPVAVAE